MAAIKSPLDKADLKGIQAAQDRINAIMPWIDKAERCGADCQEFRQLASYLHQQYGLLMQTYFPEQPSGV